jgi:hypothetical protein
MATIDPFSINFKENGLWQRLNEMVGGNKERAEAWWDTPLPYPPFNLRTPRELMTDEEWDSVRLFIEDKTMNSQAPVDYGPMDYYNSDRDGLLPDLQPNRNKYTPRGRRQRRLAGLPEDPLGHE